MPQFHEVPENNTWYWKWFTEWVSAKNAKPLFNGHQQPRVPLNNNYYNLLDTETLREQAKLMKDFAIDGLCFYHYWFNWKKILEKPAELLIKNKGIAIPFFFSRAHESWNRTRYGGNRELLIEQKYGSEKEWELHFTYLLQFFNDERYIKINNRPVFVVLRPKDIENFDKMALFFHKRAKDEWFDGLHIIETLTFWQKTMISRYTQSCFCYEPWYTLARDWILGKMLYLKWQIRKIFKIKAKSLLNIFSYNRIYRYILLRKNTLTITSKQKTNMGCFVDHDDTARRYGNAIIFKHANPKNFKKYFEMIYKKAKEMESDFIFITARNEWAEWAYLEPDTIHWTWYLEAIKNTVKND